MDIEPLKLPRKPFSIAKGRGLSSIVASLRKMEEEKLDEELDMLREMEAMEQGGDMGPPPPKKTATSITQQQPEKKMGTYPGAAEEEEETHGNFEEDEAALIEVEASFLESPSSKRKKERKQQQQQPVLLSGFDDENVYDSQDDDEMSKEGLDRNGQPLRVFKKKGQKRTTRKVNMRPTRTKRPSKPVEDEDGSEEEGEDGEDVIPETQFDATKNVAAGDDEREDDLLRSESGSGSEFDGSEGEDDEEAEASTTKAAKGAKKKTPAKENKDATAKKTKDKKKKGTKDDAGEEPAKKPRMVKATANANFKRLKLKNTGSRGGPAHNSRFRRRR